MPPASLLSGASLRRAGKKSKGSPKRAAPVGTVDVVALAPGVLSADGTVSGSRPARAATLPSELLELIHAARPAWMADAACREHPEVEFFPTRGERTDPAKAVCSGCLVRPACLAYATEHREAHGIWGGVSERERRRVRSAARRAAA